MKKFYVWGTGPAQSALIREAEVSQEAIDAALAHDFVFDSPDDWAVEVEASEDEIDEATRFDSAVAGYTEAKEGMLIGVVLTYTAHKKPIWRTYDADQESPENVLINRGVSNPPAYRVLGPYFVSSYNEAVIKEAVRNDPYESVDLDDPRTWF